MKRLIAVGALMLTLSVVASAQASVPSSQTRHVYQKACKAAGGELSDQVALVCVRFGDPNLNTDLLRHVCEEGLGGTFVFRSEFPVVLGACFF
jgi:hypothetical protein